MFVTAWHSIVVAFDVNALLLPRPSDVMTELLRVLSDERVWAAIAETSRNLAIGLTLAIVIGVAAGLPIGVFPILDLVTFPHLWALFATPREIFLPLAVVWLGFASAPKILITFLSAVIPIILSCSEGTKTVDESLVRAARSFGASRFLIFRKVVIPTTVPFIAAGVRNGIARGFAGLLVVEMLLGSGGIGARVVQAMGFFNSALVMALVTILILFSLVLIVVSKWLEALASRWREQVVL